MSPPWHDPPKSRLVSPSVPPQFHKLWFALPKFGLLQPIIKIFQIVANSPKNIHICCRYPLQLLKIYFVRSNLNMYAPLFSFPLLSSKLDSPVIKTLKSGFFLVWIWVIPMFWLQENLILMKEVGNCLFAFHSPDLEVPPP